MPQEEARGQEELITYRKNLQRNGIKDPTTGESTLHPEIESLVSEDETAGATIVGQVSAPMQLVEETGLRRSSRKAEQGMSGKSLQTM